MTLPRSNPFCSGARACLVLAAWLSLASACDTPVVCQQHGDCGEGQLCARGRCRQACNSGSDCQAGQRCVEGACLAAGEIVDAAVVDQGSDATLLDGRGDEREFGDHGSWDALRSDRALDDHRSTDRRAADQHAPDVASTDADTLDHAGAERATSDAGVFDVWGFDAFDGGGAADGRTGDVSAVDTPTGDSFAGDRGIRSRDASSGVDLADAWVALCGNGARDLGEACDDANTADGDGCSSLCAIEANYHCRGEPSRCCLQGQQDNDGDGVCQPDCSTATLFCGAHGVCADASGQARCQCDAYFHEPFCKQCAVLVSPAGSPTGGGASWADAFGDVQGGLYQAQDVASAAAVPSCAVWLAGGVYAVSASQGLDFTDGAALVGGFAASAQEPELQDPSLWPSVLDGQGAVSHVVRIQGSPEVTLASLTIRGGMADAVDGALGQGGGIYCRNSDGVLFDRLVIAGNHSRSYGAGLYTSACGLVIQRSVITDNSSESSGGGANFESSTVTLVDSFIVGNTANAHSGGVTFWKGSAIIRRSTIASNDAGGAGGGVLVGSGGSLEMYGSVVVSNASRGTGTGLLGRGGGLRAVNSSAYASGLTVVFNQAYGEGGLSSNQLNPLSLQIFNTVAWYNSVTQNDPQVDHQMSPHNSSIEGGGFPDFGNIDANPQFVVDGLTGVWISDPDCDRDTGLSVLTAPSNEFAGMSLSGAFVAPERLSGQAPSWQFPIVSNTNSQIVVWGYVCGHSSAGATYALYDYRLQATSSCVDSGKPTELEPDRDGRERVDHSDGTPGMPDMGAYEVPFP